MTWERNRHSCEKHDTNWGPGYSNYYASVEKILLWELGTRTTRSSKKLSLYYSPSTIEWMRNLLFYSSSLPRYSMYLMKYRCKHCTGMLKIMNGNRLIRDQPFSIRKCDNVAYKRLISCISNVRSSCWAVRPLCGEGRVADPEGDTCSRQLSTSSMRLIFTGNGTTAIRRQVLDFLA